jgi:hypothetical protein
LLVTRKSDRYADSVKDGLTVFPPLCVIVHTSRSGGCTAGSILPISLRPAAIHLMFCSSDCFTDRIVHAVGKLVAMVVIDHRSQNCTFGASVIDICSRRHEVCIKGTKQGSPTDCSLLIGWDVVEDTHDQQAKRTRDIGDLNLPPVTDFLNRNSDLSGKFKVLR